MAADRAVWRPTAASCCIEHQPTRSLGIEHQPSSELLGQIPDHPTSAHSRWAGSATDILSRRSVFLHKLLQGLQQLQPDFLSTHAAGQHCLVPAMQFGLSSLQYISSTLAQAGRQEWMGDWLSGAAFVGNNAAWDAVVFLQKLLDQQDTANLVWADASSSSGSSTARQWREAALPLLHAPQTMQWVCLQAVVPMLGQFLQQAAATAGTVSTKASGSSSSSKSSSSSSSSKASSGPRRAAANNEQRAAGSVSGKQWLPAALAPSMPTTYSCFLEQLGCSREVGLWLATNDNDKFGKVYPTKAATKASRQGATPSHVSRSGCEVQPLSKLLWDPSTSTACCCRLFRFSVPANSTPS